jgi:V/A-type H+-transporting ATPase subunit D
LRRELRALQRDARLALRSAVDRHGLQGLQCYPPLSLEQARVEIRPRPLLGVALQDAALVGSASFAPPPVYPSREADACRALHAEMMEKLVAFAAHSGNLERLYREYRRTARRARALQDVLLPEVGRTIGDFEARLDELERDEALWARRALRNTAR